MINIRVKTVDHDTLDVYAKSLTFSMEEWWEGTITK